LALLFGFQYRINYLCIILFPVAAEEIHASGFCFLHPLYHPLNKRHFFITQSVFGIQLAVGNQDLTGF